MYMWTCNTELADPARWHRAAPHLFASGSARTGDDFLDGFQTDASSDSRSVKLKLVLLIDDSDADLLFTQLMLESAQVVEAVVAFETAIDALDYLRQPQGRDAQVILLDINMPEMNGFEFLDIYQRLYADGQVRAAVVMLTSSPNPADQARAASYPCVKKYIVKPMDTGAAQSLVPLALESAAES
jgi:CheY-like chemotaxis protein